MSDTKFTPWPWVIESGDFESVISKSDQVDDGDIICDAPEYAKRSMKRWKANAHLIAAAPDLYEALDELVGQLEGEYFNFNAARDALAKARGES